MPLSRIKTFLARFSKKKSSSAQTRPLDVSSLHPHLDRKSIRALKWMTREEIETALFLANGVESDVSHYISDLWKEKARARLRARKKRSIKK